MYNICSDRQTYVSKNSKLHPTIVIRDYIKMLYPCILILEYYNIFS